MRQKITVYKQQIRRNHLESVFRQHRNRVKPTYDPLDIEGQDRVSEYKAVLQTNMDEINKSVLMGNYNQIIISLRQIYQELKKISRSKSIEVMMPKFMQANGFYQRIVSQYTLITSHSPKQSVLQQICLHIVSILRIIISNATGQLSIPEQLFPLLQRCLQQPVFNMHHIYKIVDIYIQIFQNDLFRLDVAIRKEWFTFDGILYIVAKYYGSEIVPGHQLNQKVLQLIRVFYEGNQMWLRKWVNNPMENMSLQGIVQNQSQSNAMPRLDTQIMTKNQIQLCLRIALSTYQYYLHTQYTSTINTSMLQSITVIRLMLEQNSVNIKKTNINYSGMMDVLRSQSSGPQLINEILILIDHIIYMDIQELTQKLVIQYQILHVLWNVPSSMNKYKFNILANLATQKQLKSYLKPYIHRIAIIINTFPNLILYTFIYNWFNSQDFHINDSMDELLISAMRNNSCEKIIIKIPTVVHHLEKIGLKSILWRVPRCVPQIQLALAGKDYCPLAGTYILICLLMELYNMGKKKAACDLDVSSQENEQSFNQTTKRGRTSKKKTGNRKPKQKQIENKIKEQIETKKRAPPKKPSKTTLKDGAENGGREDDVKKKNYMIGQKYPTPNEEDGARAFYLSLLKQRPDSIMAKKYCLEYGVLDLQEATKIKKELQKRK